MHKLFIIASDKELKRKLKDLLASSGFELLGIADDIHTALRLIRIYFPDIVILDGDLPSPGTLQAAEIIENEKLASVLLLSSTWGKDINSKGPAVSGFVGKPVTEAALLPALQTVLINHEKLLQAEREIARLKKTISERKTIERAKGVLMKKYKLSEDEAYKHMRKQSMDKRASLERVARAILRAHNQSS